jgi:transposase InsO family protein
MDNGPELTARALVDLCRFTGIDPAFIDPGSPWQNRICESFNGRFRDELLACEQFNTLLEVRVPRPRPRPRIGLHCPVPSWPPLPATFRETVDGARPNPAAIAQPGSAAAHADPGEGANG